MPKQQRIRDPLHDLIQFDVERSQLEEYPSGEGRLAE
jgi:hypothetical protein